MQTVVELSTSEYLEPVKRALIARGCWVEVYYDSENEIPSLLIKAGSAPLEDSELLSIEGIRSFKRARTVCKKVEAQAGMLAFGSGLPIIAGPCAVESLERLDEIAGRLKSLGIEWIRGGAYKPRTSPYSFQGHGPAGLKWLEEVARRHQLSVVTEVMSEFDVEAVSRSATWLQIGARNMQNFSLLKRVGDIGRPVLLKRGPSATLDEWMSSGEYLLASGAERVIFCERGVRGLSGPTRNTLDLATAVHVKTTLGQPVIVDPSHATGRRDLVVPLSKAAIAAGVDGVMVEVHPDAGDALSDGAQALDFEGLAALVAWLESGTVK